MRNHSAHWILALSLLFSTSVRAASVRVGVGVADITPPVGVPLAGWGGMDRRANPLTKHSPYSHYLIPSVGILDPIQAKVFYIQSGDRQLLFISVDLIGASRAMRKEILWRLPGFKDNEIFISGTHTHNGPGSFEDNEVWAMIAADRYHPDIYNHIVNGVMSAVMQARLMTQTVTLHRFSFETKGFQFNRRDANAPVDPTANVMLARTYKGEWLGGLLNFAIHGTILGPKNMLLSAEVNGAMASQLESRLQARAGGSRPAILFINGAEGDVDPIPGRTLSQIGNEFANQAMSYLHTAKPHTGEWIVKQAKVNLGVPRAGHCTKSKLVWGLTHALDPLAWAGFPKETYVWSIVWGDIAIMTWPGEVTSELGFGLKRWAKSKGKEGWVFGLTNDHLAYFVTPQEFAAGTYESCGSFYGSQGGAKIQSALNGLL
jgi:neutral ceramidase